LKKKVESLEHEKRNLSEMISTLTRSNANLKAAHLNPPGKTDPLIETPPYQLS
jgi:hypothetical protein